MISTKGRYALRVMADLAQQDMDSFIPLEEIAARQGISKKYLIPCLGGGYRLTRIPEEYTVGEILELVEGTLASVACLRADAEPCERREKCITLPMWVRFDRMVHDFFYGITLADLIENRWEEKDS